MTTVRILPVGDSITQGQNVSYGSYRRHLYDLLTADGLTIHFVGSLSDGSFPSPAHDGVTGDNILGAWGRIASGLIIETYAPNIILLLIGTNDIWHVLETVPTALGYYSSMLDSIATHGPNVKTIVGSLPPIDPSVAGSTVSANVGVFNSGLATLVASKGANFIFADLNAGLLTSDLADGVHPTDAGNDKMAVLWYPALYVHLLDAGSNFLVDGSGNRLTALIMGDSGGGGSPPPVTEVFPMFLGLQLRLWS
jgi:lysophospholipase L1-like esterase